jgi:hypothetical protein
VKVIINNQSNGMIDYYQTKSQPITREIVKWEKDLYKKASVRYLKTKHKEKPDLFAHWSLEYP